jgi:hypothetical protein
MLATRSVHCSTQMLSSGQMLSFYMHDGEHGLPLVANLWRKTGYSWFEGEEDGVNNDAGNNNDGGTEYNKAKGIVDDFDFSDHEENYSGENDKEEDYFDEIPLPTIDEYDFDEEDRVEALHEGFIHYY